VLIHGRLDMGGPVGTAWELTKVWPDAELIVVGDSGHTGSDTTRDHILGTLNRFAQQPGNGEPDAGSGIRSLPGCN
jgi:proline iminopeptidase